MRDQVVSIHEYALYDQARYGFPGVNQQICWLDALDDCGSFGSMMLECAKPGDAAVRKLADAIGEYMLHEQPRTSEGALLPPATIPSGRTICICLAPFCAAIRADR